MTHAHLPLASSLPFQPYYKNNQVLIFVAPEAHFLSMPYQLHYTLLAYFTLS